jgi:hypothetical protein
MIAVVVPITRPALSTSALPLVPGLRAASVWMPSPIRRPVMPRYVRRRALITPRSRSPGSERGCRSRPQLAHPEPLGIAERRRRQAAAGKAQERNVGIRIFAQDPGLHAGTVGENRLQPRRAAHTTLSLVNTQPSG